MEKIFENGVILWGKAKCVFTVVSFLAPKAVFLLPLQTLITTHVDSRYILFSGQGFQLSGEVPLVKFEWLA